MSRLPSARRAGAAGTVRHYNLLTPQTSFLDDVLTGLARPQKSISPKYFYDAVGAQLFEAICALPEYYPTRTEIAIMEERVDAIAQRIGPNSQLIEFGSGASVKTQLLIDRAAPLVYVPIDLAQSSLHGACERLASRFPWLNINAIFGDFTQPLALPEFGGVRRKVAYFPGSTIGNFEPNEAERFLHEVRRMVGSGGMLLIGVDLKKDKALLTAAYNDAQGITARFNLNLLHRMNRELAADFQPQRFSHLAYYDEAKGRIEMHLESDCAQSVRVAGCRFDFRAGETIHTEISCKYTVEEFQRLAQSARFRSEQVWTDAASLFSVHLMSAV